MYEGIQSNQHYLKNRESNSNTMWPNFILSATMQDVIFKHLLHFSPRVQEHDEDDWGKLKHVLKYLNRTRELGLIQKADEIHIIKWYVAALYAIHNDCQGHMGAMMTSGQGAVTFFSCKQKLNAKSSTEVELIGVDDALPQIL